MDVVKKQIYLSPDLNRKVQDLSKRTSRSESQIIREAVSAYQPFSEAEPDPLGPITGMVKEGDVPSDLAGNHDNYLYPPPAKRGE